MTRLLTALLIGLILAACSPSLEARREYVETHDRPERIEEAILEEKVVVGMTKEDVRAVWGAPTHINESYYAGVGGKTQWCYGSGTMMQCLYFEEGVVTGWN